MYSELSEALYVENTTDGVFDLIDFLENTGAKPESRFGVFTQPVLKAVIDN